MPKTIDQIIDILRMLEVRINSIDTEVEGLKAKARKRLFPKEPEDENLATSGINDGFDELRKLNKDHAP